jgi:hypothetical protein
MQKLRISSVFASAALAAVLAAASPALADGQSKDADTASTAAVEERAGIQTTGDVIFQDIAVNPNLSVAPVVDSTSTSQLTVVGRGSDAVSLAVPETVNLTTADGDQQTLTVVTNADGTYAVPFLSGTLAANGILSMNVGGSVQLGTGSIDSGRYSGFLVVIAQYN